MKFRSPFLVKPHSKVRLDHLRTDATPGAATEADAKIITDRHRQQLDRLQETYFAAQQKALLVVLQGMDTAGKDGTIRHIFSGVNPQGCQVAAFKVPTPLEQRHDFLWRCHEQVPPRGILGIFNRSHYEDVLSPRVHGTLRRKAAHAHMDEINDWEAMLAGNDVLILKFFLHISRDEQTRRLQERIDDPDKHWKLSPADFHERAYWDDYQDAYADVLSRTSRKHAPWFVIPSDHKWFRNLAISQILVDLLGSLKMKLPEPTFDPHGLHLDGHPAAKIAKKVTRRANHHAVDAEHDSVHTGRRA